LKKPKHIEKPKEEPQEGIKLKPIPAKEKSEEEKPEGVKLKPIPQKEKEEVKKPAPKESAPQKVMKPKEEKPEVCTKELFTMIFECYLYAFLTAYFP